MKHSFQIEGFGVRLRPVKMEDAGFIVWLRNLEHAKGRVGDSARDVAAQEAWLESYFQREGDYYFVIETLSGKPVGAYSIYNITGESAESGRWVIQPDVPAAIPSAMLAFELAFVKLGMKELRARTVATNQSVLSLNKKFGFHEVRIETGAQVIGGKSIDMVHFLLKAPEWAKTRPKMLPLAKYAEMQIHDWEKAQKTT